MRLSDKMQKFKICIFDIQQTYMLYVRLWVTTKMSEKLTNNHNYDSVALAYLAYNANSELLHKST